VVAEEHAMLGLPEVKRGLFAAAGGLARVGRRLPPALALELALTGEPVTAQRGYELGLVNRVVPRGTSVAAAIELANVICQAAPLAVRLSKRVIRTGIAEGEEALMKLQAELARDIWSSDDFAEGPRAFIEKRAPRWTGH
jgi:enoyl-CoA hydratase